MKHDRPIRALHVIDTLGAAGAEHQLATLLPHLQRCGVESEVAVLGAPYTLLPLFEESGIKVHRLDQWNAREFVSAGFRLGRIVRHGQFDVVHAHLWFSIRAVALSKLFAPRQKRFVTFHNSEYQQFPARGPVRWLHRALDRRLLRFGIDQCTSVTRFIARSNEELLKVHNMRVIFNGLDLTALRPLTEEQRLQVRHKLGVQERECLVVTAGRLGAQKGHVVLIDAVKELALEGVPIRVLIFGEGPLREELDNKIRTLGLQSVITLSGLAHHQELFQAMSAADVFAFPSRHEPFGLAAAEAMALGTPVIASNVDGLPEVVEDGVSGKLVPANDAQALAGDIRDLMADADLRRSLAVAGQRRAREKFDIAVTGAELAGLYRSTLASTVQVSTEVIGV